MGAMLSSLGKFMFGKKEMRIVMKGLGNAGKTTIIYKLKLGQVVKTIPTVAAQMETVEYRDVDFTIWEIGGQEKIRSLWKHFIHNGQGCIIFVVDSTERERIIEAKDDLHRMLAQDEKGDVLVLVFANKQDLPNAMTIDEITHKLGLNSLQHNWHIQAACAISNEGLYEGLDWLIQASTKMET
ncbi:unnamed protein product [Amaranthus hypochondriacus]